MTQTRLKRIEIQNFRLLHDVGMNLEDLTTLVVGRNNSGKTSLYELLKRFLGERPKGFRIEDFSLASYQSFCEAATLYDGDSETAVDAREKLPSITLKLFFKYDASSPNFGVLSPLIVDLDPDTDEALAVLHYGLRQGRIEEFFSDIPNDLDDENSKVEFFGLLRDRIQQHYVTTMWAEDPNDPTNTRGLERKDLSALLDTGFINAQRGLDDERGGEADILSKVLEELFLAAQEPNAEEKDQQIAAKINDALSNVQEELDKNVKGQLDDLLPSLKIFGFPALNDSELLTETALDVLPLLSNFTRVRYVGHSGIALPESYNGLGVRNLILILMRIVSYYKRFRASESPTALQVIFIEEPEAHLHPQMQEVFIRQLQQLVTDLVAADEQGPPWPVQFVVSTHSSHVANEASFESVRYFLCKKSSADPSIRHAEIKDLRTGLDGTDAETREFLHKYITLTRCDLFFADKAVLVEGMSERLMVPVMIEKLSAAQNGDLSPSSQYITVLEVGGAYAHNFFGLLKFLELKTLIVTDIDSVAQEGGKGQFKKCIVNDGQRTSNSAIKTWFGQNPCSIDFLKGQDANSKINGFLSIAYQCSDHVSEACGRSFEDSFMLANATKFALAATGKEELENETFSSAADIKKSEFALEYSVTDRDWTTPKYIQEGLYWLVDNSVPDPEENTEVQTDE